jgi:hypothetical protein
MALSIYKWLMISFLYWFIPPGNFQSDTSSKFPLQGVRGLGHPYYISVVEINHNPTDKTLEISCKIFTNDFETILEKNYKTKVDLVNPPDKSAMDKLVSDYIKKHLSVKADNKAANLSYVGFEKQDEAVYSYFQVDNVPSAKKIDVTNSILHDFSDQQINIIHCTVGGKRQSDKLDYPKTEASFQF